MVDWPLEEMLLAYLAIVRAEAAQAHDLALIRWTLLLPHQAKKPRPPRAPVVLKFDHE